VTSAGARVTAATAAALDAPTRATAVNDPAPGNPVAALVPAARTATVTVLPTAWPTDRAMEFTALATPVSSGRTAETTSAGSAA
jgi:hypothetical protein